jgi:nucleoside 2-deoxyribosyltransferase
MALPLDTDGFESRNKRVLVYGGTLLKRKRARFVSDLTYRLLENKSIRVMTGGFRRSAATRDDLTSTDMAALEGVQRFVRDNSTQVDKCLETWLPDPTRDRAGEQVERFREGKVEVMQGLSAQARRLKLVQLADATVTVSGQVQTALVLELALAMARPALPLPFTGRDSANHWRDNRSYYVARLGISEVEAQSLETFNAVSASRDAIDACIAQIVATINRVISRTCLVLMPFSKELDPDYEMLIEIIRAEGFHSIRLDRELYAGDVRETVVRLLRECDAVVADVTTRSPNVMYEVGLAHAVGRKPLLLWRGPTDTIDKDLPFYLRPQRVAAGAGATLTDAVKTYLKEARSGK